MIFKSEKEMVALLKATLENTYSSKSIQISCEVSLGFGIADMVVSSLKNETSESDRTEQRLGASEINIFTLLESREKLTLLELMITTRIDKYRLQSILSNLTRRNLIKLEDDKYSVLNDFDLFFENNFAIEAKLRDWKRALKQAYRYLWFAEYSFVVLDEYFCRPAIEHQKLFEQYNVGLASINDKGELKRYFTPPRKKPYDINMQRLFSEKLKSDLLVV